MIYCRPKFLLPSFIPEQTFARGEPAIMYAYRCSVGHATAPVSEWLATVCSASGGWTICTAYRATRSHCLLLPSGGLGSAEMQPAAACIALRR